MAHYQRCLAHLLAWEGTFISSWQSDLGGLTCCGISYRYHPEWGWWEHVKVLWAERDGSLVDVSENVDLMAGVRKFYLERYWIPLRLDMVQSEELGMELLEQSVNMGRRRTVRRLQNILNALRPSKAQGDIGWITLTVDGILGRRTLTALSEVQLNNADLELVIGFMNAGQASHYLSRALEDPTQRVNLRGWARRAGFLPILGGP